MLRRIAVIGDVHAQDERLFRALQAISRLRVDAILCTGDIADGSGDVNRCCTLLEHHDVLCVRGNHDRWVFTGMLRDRTGATQLASLTPPSEAFLRALPATRELETPAGVALLCHGIGEYDLERITEHDTEYSLRANPCLRDIREARRYRILMNGHSHTRLVREVPPLSILNAGTLKEADAGFVEIDFERSRWRWHSLAEEHREADEGAFGVSVAN